MLCSHVAIGPKALLMLALAGVVNGVLVDALAFIGAALGSGAVQLPFAGMAMILGFAVWGDVPTPGLLVGSAIVAASSL
jgi:hypothetical protein